MCVESIRLTVVITGVVIYNQHKIVCTVVGEVIVKLERIPALCAVERTLIDQRGL